MLSSHVNRFAGVVMVLLAVLLAVALFAAQTPDTEPDAFAADFQKVVDDEVVYLIGQAVQVAVGVLVAILGAALYYLLRARDRLASLIGYTGFVVLGVLFAASSAAYVTVHDLANELDAGETIADEAGVQEIARTLVQFGDGLFFLSVIFFAIGLLAFGWVLKSAPGLVALDAPEPGINNPAWLGWIAVAAGVCYLVGWFGAIGFEWFFVLVIVAFFLTIVWYAAFGIWMLTTASKTGGRSTLSA